MNLHLKGAQTNMYKNCYNRKEYMRQYYKDHREKMLNQSKKWHKDHPRRMREINKRWRDKRGFDKTNYDKKGLKALYIEDYGKDLENKKRLIWSKHQIRLFCLDCKDYGTDLCPGWSNCKYKLEVMKIIES